MGTGRYRPTARSKVAANTIRRSWAGGATASELRHRDRLAWLADAANGTDTSTDSTTGLFERLGDRAAVRVVEPRRRVIVVRLVRVEVRQGRDCVRVWLELRSRIGRGGRCVSDRASPRRVRRSVEPGTARSVCWQGDGSVVGVEFWPLNLLICATATTYDCIDRIERREEERKKKKGSSDTRRDRSWGKGEERNTHCCHSRPTASG